MDLLTALGATVASVTAFSRIGREIDRPLWKVADDREAFKRFFLLWFLISLSVLTVLSLLGKVDDDGPWAAPLMFGFFVMFLLAVPAGTCIMFSGHFAWSDLPHALAPLAYQLSKAMAVVFVNFLAFVGWLGLMNFLIEHPALRAAPWFLLLLEVPFGIVDCFVCAGVWLICTVHRRDMEEQDRHDGLGF